MQLLGHGNPFHEAPGAVFVLTLMPVEARNPLAMEPTERWRLLRTMRLSSR